MNETASRPMPFRTRMRLTGALAALAVMVIAAFVPARAAAQASGTYTGQEIIDSGHQFFGSTSGALASLVERIFSQYGQPNGYVLGQEGGGAIVAGVTFGEGTLYTKNAGDHPVFWQGPSLGFDFGAEGARTMMLVYNLSSVDAIYRRFAGVSGSAYAIGGLGMTALESNGMVLVPIRTGVGARLGINVGYLKVTNQATWNPF